jgi:acylaminoacyl-peptidase
MVGIKDFINYRSLSDLKTSPDQTKLSYIVWQADPDTNGYRRELWIYDIDRAENRKLLDNGEWNGCYAWTDKETVLYIEKTGEEGTCCRFKNVGTPEGGESFRLSKKASVVIPLDKEHAAVIINEDIRTEEYPEELAFLEDYDRGHAFEILDEIPFWNNGEGFTSKRRNTLYQYNFSDGSLQRISDQYSYVDRVYHKDGALYYIARTFDDRNTEPGIYRYDLKDGRTEELVKEGRYRINELAFCGEDVIFAAQDRETGSRTDDPSFYRAGRHGLVRLPAEAISCGSSVNTDCAYGSHTSILGTEEGVCFLSTKESGSFILKYDLKDRYAVLTEDNGSVEDFAIAGGKIFFIGLRNMGLQELYRLDTEGRGEIKLTDFNRDSLRKEDVSIPETFTFMNNGFRVNYIVLKPVGYDKDRKYPAIFYIHGGAKTLYAGVFFHEMQYLAGQGYFVIYGNPRGSDGQGGEFARLLGHYGEKDYEDIMKAADRALELYPAIEDKRLGIAGGSYGGIMVNWIVGHTDRFACACAQRSISNMVTAFGTADNGFNFVREQMDADPWNELEKLWGQSPLKYADRCRTPLLLIHSDEDFRCHYTEALQMFTALKYHGTESRVCLIRGENHSLSRTGRPAQRIKRLYEILRWFDLHLKQGWT